MKKHSYDQTKLAVVILSYNVKNDLLACIESIFKSKMSFKFEVIVVDNNSGDGSVKAVQEKFPQVKMITTGENLGFTGGNNIGIREALKVGATQVLILNPDTLLSTNLLADLVRVANSDKNVGIVSPKIYFAPGYEYHDRYNENELGKVFWYAGAVFDKNNVLSSHKGVDQVDHGQFEDQCEVDFVSGCAMMVKKEVFEKIGFFDDRYFLYLEDLEFSWRAKMNGYKIIYSPVAAVWHKNAQSAQVGSKLQDYYITRNRLFFAAKYLSLRTKLALWREAIRFVLTGGVRREAVFDFWQGKMGRKDFK